MQAPGMGLPLFDLLGTSRRTLNVAWPVLCRLMPVRTTHSTNINNSFLWVSASSPGFETTVIASNTWGLQQFKSGLEGQISPKLG